MNDEYAYRETVTVKNDQCDPWGALRCENLLTIFSYFGERGSRQCGVGSDVLGEKNLAWVLNSIQVALKRPILWGESLWVSTWPGAVGRLLCPRYFQVLDENQAPVGACTSSWLLMDTLQRKIVRPSRIGLELPASAAPLGLPDVPEKISLNADLEFLTERKVCYGDIDQNMHMNNARYCAWINDLLPLSFHRENWLSQVHIAFHKEQGDGQSVRISGAFDETGAFVVKGEEGETLTFAAELRYQKRSA